ncbi:hypothetical protein NLJ89_g3326 [Agrocybe chaxingu]|uniref:Carboxylic ester hydrolase n=1 Tax=Agrocybe chaxingu TaxID=84603 RepID=A0A9W8K537_9AGAR|nr:hypothetical protein NLJ89_g3326 [Agrocybe chaxingu]
MISTFLFTIAFHVLSTLAVPLAAPSITIDGATFKGTASGTTEKFLGVPFAQPPIGNLRYRLPQPITYSAGTYDATEYGPACGQQVVRLPVEGIVGDVANSIVETAFGKIFPDDEDCLTVNIVRPKGTLPTAKLPVVAWIFGGGFQLGSASMYDGGVIVDRSLELSQPVVYVSMNYRLTAFGFLASKEVKDAGVGNLGLHDQRQALRWVNKYISLFGGDPTKVTIWGQSAGAISVSLQLIANGGNTEGLFRAAFMQSGAPVPVGDITNGQPHYDALVQETGCAGSTDTLQCLRTVPYATLKKAINNSPGLFGYQALFEACLQGKVAKIPYITGNCDDEGTLFSLPTLNITTTTQFKNYIKNTFLTGITDAQVNEIAELYPPDITKGSPFDTGILNAVTPQFKRLAAFFGDGVFQAPRRWLLDHTAGKQDVWAYVSKRFKILPVLGSLHAHDILNYAGGDMGDHLIRFANNLNPNGQSGYQWPKYTLATRQLATYRDGLIKLSTSTDNYRKEAMEAINAASLENPV